MTYASYSDTYTPLDLSWQRSKGFATVSMHTELNLFVSEACTLRARFPGTAGDDTGALLGTHKPIDLRKQACQGKYLNVNDVSLYDIYFG
jgi:hypothetical protein